MILASADHDLSRLACGTRTQEQLRPAFAFLLTWGTVPSIYYGDEIGMRYLPGLPDVEGAICNPAYNRAGCRTPMQWDGGGERRVLDAPRPTRSTCRSTPIRTGRTSRPSCADPGSTAAPRPRRSSPCAGASRRSAAGPRREVLHAGYPLAYVRGGTHLVVVNPRRDAAAVDIDRMAGAQLLLGEGAGVDGSTVTSRDSGSACGSCGGGSA